MYGLAAVHFVFGKGEAHVLAQGVVLDDADAHSLVGGYLLKLGDVDVVEVVHAHGLLRGLVVGVAQHFDVGSRLAQFLDGLVTQTAALRAPESDAGLELQQIALELVEQNP